MTNKKVSGFHMRISPLDKSDIFELSKRLRCSEAEAIRNAVAFMLEATKNTRFPNPKKIKNNLKKKES